jgi:hypothetical protein
VQLFPSIDEVNANRWGKGQLAILRAGVIGSEEARQKDQSVRNNQHRYGETRFFARSHR